jgi:hypothetical protein
MLPAETLRLVAAGGVFLAALAIAAAPGLAIASGSRRPAAHVTAADRRVFERLIAVMKGVPPGPRGGRLTAAGLALEGTPYAAGALEVPGPERLVCHLGGLDCVTFVETCLAAARTSRLDPPSPRMATKGRVATHQDVFEEFMAELRLLRYRDGTILGYASRLHYFSEWLRQNAARGVLADLTADLGGVPEIRQIDYMTTHRKLYPRLASDRTFQAMLAVEAALSARPLIVIPRDRLAAAEGRLEDGDIVAIVPTTEGLDVSHTGLVRRGTDGRVHLLHAPDVGDRVRTTIETLGEYVAAHPKVRGLMVARPL